jgi:hypothetical protein
MTIAIAVVMIADPQMDAGTDAADMDADADLGVRGRCAQQTQCKNRCG